VHVIDATDASCAFAICAYGVMYIHFRVFTVLHEEGGCGFSETFGMLLSLRNFETPKRPLALREDKLPSVLRKNVM
jgi:hypothetical protein